MKRTTIAAVFLGVGKPLEIREVAIPALRAGEILVEVVACTLCGSDLHSIEGRRDVPLPTILGHEILGRIAEFGPNAPQIDAAGEPLELGDRVTWAIVASCGKCFFCLRRLPQNCERQTKYGHETMTPGGELTGGLAGHCILVPGTAIFKVPPNLSDAVACPANCATATVAAAIEASGDLEGANVLVTGGGMLGVTMTAWARALGARNVIVSDVSPARLDMARAFGATHATSPGDVAMMVRESSEGRGVDVAVELSGSPDAVESLIGLTRVGGTIVLVGSVYPARMISISAEQIVRRCLTTRGIHNYGPSHLEAALRFLSTHRQVPFDALVNDWRPLTALSSLLSEPLPPNKLRMGVRPES